VGMRIFLRFSLLAVVLTLGACQASSRTSAQDAGKGGSGGLIGTGGSDAAGSGGLLVAAAGERRH